MSRFSRSTEKTDRARELRRTMTRAEWKLWGVLRGGALGASFRRQHPIGPYFADFYCAPLKLVVELDGSQHADRIAYDANRTTFLNAQGMMVLRFWNGEVMENIDGVAQVIMEAIRKREFDLTSR